MPDPVDTTFTLTNLANRLAFDWQNFIGSVDHGAALLSAALCFIISTSMICLLFINNHYRNNVRLALASTVIGSTGVINTINLLASLNGYHGWQIAPAIAIPLLSEASGLIIGIYLPSLLSQTCSDKNKCITAKNWASIKPWAP